MASWDRKFTGGSYPGQWNARLDYWSEESGNSSLIHLRMYVWGDPGYSQNGTWVPRVRGSWMGEVGGNSSQNIGSGMVLMVAHDQWVGHDVNGNLYVTIGDYCNAPINDMAWGDIGWTLPRIAEAPGIAGIVADQIKVTTARLGMEITGFGHGTSAAMRMYYRVNGSGSGWTQTADQGDAAGYNYWDIGGLTPSVTYEYFTRVWNNNGDTRDSGTATFTTLPAPNTSQALLGVAGVL
jgi:hypothetical protein